MRWTETIVQKDSDEAELDRMTERPSGWPDRRYVQARCRAQMARHDSQLARGEAASVSARGIAAIHKMLLVGHPRASMPSVLPEPIEAVGLPVRPPPKRPGYLE